jgi:hypothetical protein
MTFATDFKLINMMNAENVNLCHGNLNTSLEKPGTRRTIHLELYDSLSSRA